MKIKKLSSLFLILCIVQLFYIFHFRSGFNYEILKNPFSENSGVSYALPPEAIELKKILVNYQAKDFNLSKSIRKDTYIYQRSIEFNYPIRINKTSKLTIFLLNEEVTNNCNIIETGKYLKLTKC